MKLHTSLSTAHVLTLLFAMGTWLSVNSVWMELPLLTAQLPEGKS